VELRDQIAIVTGAGRGIGEAIAVHLAREGAHVILAARTLSEIETVAAGIRADGGQATCVTVDVTKRTDIDRLVRHAMDAHGRIDVLVNNAGVYGPIGPFADTELDDWWRALETNLGGTMFCARAVIPHMMARRRGRIINLSGGGATSPLPNLTAYSVSKTAVVRLTENLAEELKPYNIQVNAIAPGAVDTRLQNQLLQAGDRAGADLHRRIKAMRETGEGGVPPTVAAELAVFLASAASNGLTGKLISAPHDPWRDWAGRGEELSASPMYTLRRLDPFTLRPLLNTL